MIYSSTPQAPLPSGFGPGTTAREVLADRRLDSTIAIVTGGYAGLGLETTRVLVGAGARVIVPARSLDKARAATADLPNVTLDALDLADPTSVAAFAERFVAAGRPLHLLINNAGIMATPLARDARGFESQFATNHLGHFELTVRLWPALQKAQGARVVALSSRGHARASVDLEDPNFRQRPYDKWLAYGQAKTANALFALALDRRGQAEGVRAFSVHPGAILTELTRSMDEEERRVTIERTRGLTTLKNVEQGASTSVWCATSPQLAGKGGVYCEDADIAQAVAADHDGVTGVRPWAMDAGLAERLWQKSEEWTGVRLG